MISPFDWRISLLTAVLVFCVAGASHAYRSVPADPDRISSEISWNATPQISLGDIIRFKDAFVAGMVVVRNEKRFNQGLLPNHNWRGFVIAGYTLEPHVVKRHDISFHVGFEHESAHPTMGIREQPRDASQMVYDGTYRRYMLNSLLVGGEKRWSHSSTDARIKADYQLYAGSKNTPELATHTTGISNGVSIGAEIRKRFQRISVYLSLFDRYILEGPKTDRGEIYIDDNESIVKQLRTEPVIQDINTFTAKAGISLPFAKGNRRCELYVSYLHGNIFGFVDSRETRDVWRTGVAVTY